MDSGFLRLLSCAALRPAHLAGLCGFHAAGTLEGTLPTAAPKEGRELFDNVVGVLSIFQPSAPRLPAGMRVARCFDTQVGRCSRTMDLRESMDI